MVPDSKPVIGQSFKYRNLYLNFGCQDHRMDTYIKNAELVRDELLYNMGIKKDKEVKIIDQVRPERYEM